MIGLPGSYGGPGKNVHNISYIPINYSNILALLSLLTPVGMAYFLSGHPGELGIRMPSRLTRHFLSIESTRTLKKSFAARRRHDWTMPAFFHSLTYQHYWGHQVNVASPPIFPIAFDFMKIHAVIIMSICMSVWMIATIWGRNTRQGYTLAPYPSSWTPVKWP